MHAGAIGWYPGTAPGSASGDRVSGSFKPEFKGYIYLKHSLYKLSVYPK